MINDKELEELKTGDRLWVFRYEESQILEKDCFPDEVIFLRVHWTAAGKPKQIVVVPLSEGSEGNFYLKYFYLTKAEAVDWFIDKLFVLKKSVENKIKKAEKVMTPSEHSKIIQSTMGSSSLIVTAHQIKAQADELKQKRVQLVRCSTIALGYDNGYKQGDYGWSPAYEDVKNLRKRYEKLLRNGGCTLTGPGRGDCKHAVGLPGNSIPGQHDGEDDTVDVHEKPNGWCWSCWRIKQNEYLHAQVSSLEYLHNIVKKN